MSGLKKQLKKPAAFAAAALGVVATSVLLTFYASDMFANSSGQRRSANTTFTDAVLACEERARRSFKGPASTLALDDHSSRFDSGASQYRVFLRGEIPASGGDTEEQQFFISCYVNSFGGRIVHYEQLKQKESPSEAIRRGSSKGLFGWPR